MRQDPVQMVILSARSFQREVRQILMARDDTPERVYSLEFTRRRLSGLSLAQHQLFEEALKCIQVGAYRAAHVMAWAAFIDFFEQKMAEAALDRLKKVRPKWAHFGSMGELREEVSEHALIEAAKDARVISKATAKTLQGLLAKRNECAHPSPYNPGMNETIGYVAELLNRIEALGREWG